MMLERQVAKIVLLQKKRIWQMGMFDHSDRAAQYVSKNICVHAA